MKFLMLALLIPISDCARDICAHVPETCEDPLRWPLYIRPVTPVLPKFTPLQALSPMSGQV